MCCAELFGGEAGGAGFVREVMVGAAPNECQITGRELDRGVRVVEPQSGPALNDGVDRQLDGAGQAQPPRRVCH
jgi:hypothetical protein